MTNQRKERRHHERRQHYRPPGDTVDRVDFDALARRFDELSDRIDRNVHSLTVQFERIAQLQVTVDRCVEKVGLVPAKPPTFRP